MALTGTRRGDEPAACGQECPLERRPLPDPGASEVLAWLPRTMSAAVVATTGDKRRLGAAWWHLHEPSLILATDGSPLPELRMAVAEDARGHGVGTALIEVAATNAALHFTALALNLHLHNPRYASAGDFRVAAKATDGSAYDDTRAARPNLHPREMISTSAAPLGFTQRAASSGRAPIALPDSLVYVVTCLTPE